ncbi:MAG: DUF924 family protein [Wenzhouxiangella sp.]
MTANASDVLTFWFETLEPAMWWTVDPALDQQIGERFGTLLDSAAAGELFEWRADARGRLAEIIVLDQFSRNVFRGTPLAFSQDAMSLVMAQEAVSLGLLDGLSPIERAFLLLPYMHSESRRIHVEAERLYREFAPEDNYQFELKHKVIIDRFGRYPHRNEILGRESTPEEIELLKQPGSSF